MQEVVQGFPRRRASRICASPSPLSSLKPSRFGSEQYGAKGILFRSACRIHLPAFWLGRAAMPQFDAGAWSRIGLVTFHAFPNDPIERGWVVQVFFAEVHAFGLCCPPGGIVRGVQVALINRGEGRNGQRGQPEVRRRRR